MTTSLGQLLPVGVTATGITHSASALPDWRSRVRMARASGAFDFITRTPLEDEYDELCRAVEESGLPVLAGTSQYMAGRDEPLFESNIQRAKRIGSRIHDVQLFAKHADGHWLDDQEVADAYSRFYDRAAALDIAIGFEVHVDMWSEHFGRVIPVAHLVERRGIPFMLTFDPSHVIFKIDNPSEQAVQGMDRDVASGRLVLDPRASGNVLLQWIESNYVMHCHARSAAPANPVNTWARHPDGRYGRGIQYPLVSPGPDEWHSAWEAERLEPWMSAIRQLLTWHARNSNSRLQAITCEFIPAVDYGGGARYSIFEQNIACAYWLREQMPKVFKS